ncbi:esterase [Virgisporangium ochraceum]|uniref:Esterase n=1 Tax=Virgisporangium ochraceum TaxID=65505 RepID=A0A8J3ZUB2_9ACTN|nr:esterase [Virgisporangium ochraceum]
MGGSADPRFAGVRDAFEALGDPGNALAVVHAGEVVVDLYGGWRDAARTEPWTPGTLVHVFSVGKAVVAAGLVRLLEGRFDDPVAAYWPEFAANGKAETTVRHVLAHTAGLPAFPEQVKDPTDWHGLCAMLAAAEPEFPAGTAVAEHAMTYGHLVGELIRRVDGRMPGEYLRAEYTGFALGETDGEQARTAELEYAHPDWPAQTIGTDDYRRRVLDNPPGWLALDVLNSPTWREAQVPAVNLHTTALALARFYAALPEQEIHARGEDLLLRRHVNWGLGVQVEETGEFGMGGIGGCDAFADPAKGYAYAYVTRSLGGFDRSERLIEALEECL